MEFVVHMINSAVPAGAAIITVPAPTSLRMAIAWCAAGYSRRGHARERVDVRSWAIDHVSAETHAEIDGNHVAQF